MAPKFLKILPNLVTLINYINVRHARPLTWIGGDSLEVGTCAADAFGGWWH